MSLCFKCEFGLNLPVLATAFSSQHDALSENALLHRHAMFLHLPEYYAEDIVHPFAVVVIAPDGRIGLSSCLNALNESTSNK